MFRSVRAGLGGCVLAMVLAASGAAQQALPYEKLAREWLTARELDPDAKLDLLAVLDEHFLRLELGAYDVFVPPAGLTERPEDVAGALRALVSAQATWLGWCSASGKPEAQLGKDLKLLRAWTKALREKDLVKAAAAEDRDLLGALKPRDKVRTSLANLRSALLGASDSEPDSGETDQGAKAARPAARVVLMPRRADFVPFACVVGWVLADWRSAFWADNLGAWTEFDFEGTRVMALEYASPTDSDLEAGMRMTAKNANALEEHVAQLGTRALLEARFGDRVDPLLAAGLANNLVIDAFGEVDTRTDGDLRSRSASARSVFIPGGNKDGGSLPPANADSRWRESKGKDYFVRALRQSQKQAAKSGSAKDDRGFLLIADEGERHVVRAPFFGTAGASAPPDRFLGDHGEFLRAYRAAFLHWLRHETLSSKKKSQALFAEWLQRLDQEPDASLTTLLEAVYGMPISAPDLGADSLEGEFLGWLARQR